MINNGYRKNLFLMDITIYFILKYVPTYISFKMVKYNQVRRKIGIK